MKTGTRMQLASHGLPCTLVYLSFTVTRYSEQLTVSIYLQCLTGIAWLPPSTRSILWSAQGYQPFLSVHTGGAENVITSFLYQGPEDGSSETPLLTALHCLPSETYSLSFPHQPNNFLSQSSLFNSQVIQFHQKHFLSRRTKHFLYLGHKIQFNQRKISVSLA